jgi:hypothetical protein
MTNNSYEITVYADSLMQTELKKDTLNIDYHEDLVLILGMEEDLRDGEDWWDDIVMKWRMSLVINGIALKLFHQINNMEEYLRGIIAYYF